MRIVTAVIPLFLAFWCGAVGQAETDLEKKIDDLFIKASNPEAHHQDLVEPSRQELGMMGKLAVPRLITKLSTEDARERHALDDIFGRIGSVAVPALVEALDTDSQEILKNASRALGEIGDRAATPALLPLFRDQRHTVRSTAVTAVGQCHDSSAVYDCVSLLSDSVETVRKSAAVALGRIADSRAAPSLIAVLDDIHFSVRMSAVRSLIDIGAAACDGLMEEYGALSDIGRYLAFEVWAGCEYRPAGRVLEKETRSSDRYARGFAIHALASVDPKAAQKRMKQMIRDEADLFVLSRLDAAQKKLPGAKTRQHDQSR